MATEGDDGDDKDSSTTLPTPPPGHEGHPDEEPIDLRYELEELRLSLGLADQADPIRVDEAGRFEIRSLRGRGAMGAVYEAYDTELDCPVALKVVGAVSAGRERLQERLLQEARALAQIDHENVVRVRDVRIAVSGERVVALDYVQGPTLRAWQRERRIPELLDAYTDAARGLAEAHDMGVIHRDFKPDNVLYNTKKDHVVVVDFGLAGGVVDAQREPKGLLSPVESTGLGTPEYMAPEQHLRPADARCDQYALCMSLWEAIDGKRPFDSDRGSGHELPPAPPDMPGWLYRVLARGLAYEPRARFPDMHTLVRALDRGRRWSRYSRRGLLGAGGAAVVTWLTWTFLIPGPCDDAARPVEAVWNDEVRTQVRESLASLDLPWAERASSHVVATLDAAAAAWSREATTVCEATELSERTPTLDRQAACLDEWLDRMSVTVNHLREGDEQLASRIVELLDPLVASEDLCRLPPPVIETDVRRLLTEAESLEQLRELDAARAKAETAVERASQAKPCLTGSDRSHAAAAAHFRLGHILGSLERWDAARGELRIAADHALACGDAWTAFDVRSYEAGVVYPQSDASELELAEVMLADAGALLLPASGTETSALRHVEHQRMRGLLLLAGESPDYDAALAALEDARQRLEANPHAPLQRRTQIQHNLGLAYQQAGRHENAEAAYGRAVELLSDALGSEYPNTVRAQAFVDVNRGLVALQAGDLPRAEQLLSDAADAGDPLVVVRAWSGWLQARILAGMARSSGPLARQFIEWLDARQALPWRPRAEALTTIGQVLMQTSITEAGAIDPVETFELGVSISREGLRLWEQYEPDQVPVARYILASSLYDGGRNAEARVIVDQLLARDLEASLENVVRDLDEKITSEGERLRASEHSTAEPP